MRKMSTILTGPILTKDSKSKIDKDDLVPVSSLDDGTASSASGH